MTLFLYPDINVDKSLSKYIDYPDNPSHKGAIKWLTGEKDKIKPQFRKSPTGFYIAYCSKCGDKQMPNNEWQIKDGSTCCRVEYVIDKPNIPRETSSNRDSRANSASDLSMEYKRVVNE